MSILQKGDTVGLIAPSMGLNDEDLTLTLQLFAKVGLNVISAPNLQSSFRYMAGSDIERAEALNAMIANPQIKALFCLRGGAGATRMLDFINFALLRQNPKPIIGLSDSTALQNAAFTMSGNISLSGFLPLYDTKNGLVNAFMLNELSAALFENNHVITSGTCLNQGTTQGQLVGGCLSVFNLLCGTRYFPDLSDKILLLEDIGEKTYKIDLMFNQLKQQQGFNQLRGIILGAFTDCLLADATDGTIADCIKDFTAELKIPVVTDFAYGHIPQRHILPLGGLISLQAALGDCKITWQS